jgi:hypothetical protein
MLNLLQNTRQDVNGVILSRETLMTCSTIILSLITGITCLQGAENDDVTDHAVAVENSDKPVVQPRIPRSSVPITGRVHSSHDATVRPPNHTVACPDCVTSNQAHHRIRHRHEGCGDPKCTSCHNACCPSGHHAGRHPYIHGQIRCEGTPLHPHHNGHGGFGNFAGSCRGGGCYAGTRVIGSPAVERAIGVGGMRISEWPSPCTGLTLTEEQDLFLGAGHCATCQPSCKPAYMNIPDHVWE